MCLQSVSNFSPLFCFSWFCKELPLNKGFPAGSVEKKIRVTAGDPGDAGLIPGSGVGNGNLIQYSCLENSNGQRSLAGCGPRGRKESDMTKCTCACACGRAYTHTRMHTPNQALFSRQIKRHCAEPFTEYWTCIDYSGLQLFRRCRKQQAQFDECVLDKLGWVRPDLGELSKVTWFPTGLSLTEAGERQEEVQKGSSVSSSDVTGPN